MATIHAFNAVRPTPENVEKVAAPPYDVVSREEAAQMAEGNPLSFLRVSRPEIELPEVTDLYADEVYDKAASNYERLRAEAPLLTETDPAVYIYSLNMGGHEQDGIVATYAVDEYDNGTIKTHEKTRKQKETDRTRHIEATKSQTGPVFLTYPDNAAINDIVADVKQNNDPLFDFVAPDNVRHAVWRIPATVTQQIIDTFKEVPYLYIADGHHRAAAASRVRQNRKKLNADHTGDEEYNRVLSVIFPAQQMKIMPYNRVVSGLNGHDSSSLFNQINAAFEVEKTAETTPKEPGIVHMYFQNEWWALRFKQDIRTLPLIQQLDVSILQDNLLQPVLGIDDPRSDERIDFVGGIRGTEELVRRVDSGQADIAFSLYPTTVDQLMAVADANESMPPKSTWFEPKLRDALLIHDI